MTSWFGAALLIVALTFGGSVHGTALASSTAARLTQAVDLSARRHRHRNHDAYRPSYPSYYGRPTYYAPAPFYPIPPLFGYGWEAW